MKKLLGATILTLCVAGAASITINPDNSQQEVIGFGAGTVYYQGWLTQMSEAKQEAFFDTAFTGLNLSLLRLGNWKQEDSINVSDDVKILTAARKRLGKDHLKIQMSSWSAPARLKESGVTGGKDRTRSENSLKKSSSDPYGKYVYCEFAHWWKHSYQIYDSLGIAPDYISIQNELDWPAEYEETLFDPTENDEVAGYKQAIQAIRDSMRTLPNPPKILGPEPLGIGYEGVERYMRELDQNSLDGIAFHLYNSGEGHNDAGENYLYPENFRNTMKSLADQFYSKTTPIFVTEFCPMQAHVREQDMIGLAHIIQVGFTSGKLSGYIAWNLLWGGVDGQFIGICPGPGWGECTEENFYINPEYHGMRHYSKFVNPGWHVIETVSDNEKIYPVAFQSADKDSITLVTINKAGDVVDFTPPALENYTVTYAVQSVENGEKSKTIECLDKCKLPDYSVTTIVYVKDTPPEETDGPEQEQVPEQEKDSTISIFAKVLPHNNQNDKVKLFDVNGNLVWSGEFHEAVGSNGNLKLNIRKGIYIIRNSVKKSQIIRK